MDALGVFEPTGTLQDIVPSARPALQQLLDRATALGMRPHIRSVGRTCADQQALFEQGSQTTRAALCRSAHVLGHAVDLTLYPDTCDTYRKLGEWWESIGGTWGGRWTSFGPCGDAGHFHFMGRQQAVPTTICPNDVTLAQCEQIRDEYLRAAFSTSEQPAKRGWVAPVALGIVVGLGIWLKWLS